MTPSDLLMTLIDRGVRLKVAGDRLVYAAPRGTMTAELVEQLREQKAELVGLVTRRMCNTCGSAGRCELRVPMADGGWACQAALNAGLLSNAPADESDDHRRHVHYDPPAAREARDVERATDQARLGLDEADAGCGERVPTRTAAGVVWVRCTGRETCDGVCTRAELWTEAAS